ncbi:MAG: hypothetical protein ABIH24_04495 [Verrucomicrobiota bacterium]
MTRLGEQINQLYDFVINDRKLDFMVYADHHHMGNMIRLGYREQSPWKIVSDKADSYNRNGKFIALKGYEFQDGMEYNVYLRDDKKLPMADNWSDLIKGVGKNEKNIILAAHNRPCPTDWRFKNHPNFRMIEILNDGGVFEGWANDGLAEGHRGGFYGGSDDHSCQPAKNAITGIWAAELTTDAVWDALWNRRFIASANIRNNLFFQLNGHPLGSEIRNERCKFRKLDIFHEYDTKPALVIVIKNGAMFLKHIPEHGVFSFSFEDKNKARSGNSTDYYYVKVIYPDGRMAFSSPIWVVNGQERERSCFHPPGKAYPAITEWRSAKEWGERIGYHRFTNAGNLGFARIQAPKRIRDMVSHVGPDALLVTKERSIVYPAMDGIYERTADGKVERLKAFSTVEYHWLITALIEFEDSIIAAGYYQGEKLIFSLKGKPLDSMALDLFPISPYYYQNRLVTPQYLATDGVFMYWLLERECLVITASGKCLGTCQQDFPAFPCALAVASINRICVLSCDRKLICYDLSASQEGKVAWAVNIPEYCCSLVMHADEVWTYNDKISQLSINKNIPFSVFSIDTGAFKGIVKPDLKNIRGSRIAFMNNNEFIAIHNPNLNASAIYRDSLNAKGVLKIFAKC